jgi:hypothetical protein
MKKFYYFLLLTLSVFLHAVDMNPINPQPKDFIRIGCKNSAGGMFATVGYVLGHLSLYETGYYKNFSGLKVDFEEDGLYYDPAHGPNWWEYYFEPICLGSSKSFVKVATEDMDRRAWIARRRLSREDVFKLISNYVRIRKGILDKVDEFVADNFDNFFIIGVHYRGTDKWKEAPRVPYEEAIRVISEQANQLPKDAYKIFVATDEQAFLDHIRQIFPGKVFATDAHRSKNTLGVHHSENNHYELGEQALVDALLLSKCDLLIRTSSNLSLWSSYFNPDLPVIILNYKYGHEKE